MTRIRDLVLWLAVALPVITTCSHDSYLVVTLLSGDTAFTGVSAVEVTVNAPGRDSKTLTPDYDATREPTFDTHAGPRLSVAFTPDSLGPVDIVVTVKSDTNPCLGRGIATAALLKRGDTSRVDVKIFHVIGACPGSGGGSDASADGPGPATHVTFPGCDPAELSSCPTAQACFVDCVGQAATCVPAGARGPGERCSGNADCAPGNECFDFSGIAGCTSSTKLCMKFCGQDSDCTASTPAAPVDPASMDGQADDGGAPGPMVTPTSFVYPGGSCRSPVQCNGGVVTSYRSCSFACDPRGDARTGCPDGLLCFLFKNLSGGDGPDCGCRAPAQTGTDGVTCASSANCAPGFVCNQQGTNLVCRQLCVMGAATDCGANRTCTPLRTSAAFGVCL